MGLLIRTHTLTEFPIPESITHLGSPKPTALIAGIYILGGGEGKSCLIANKLVGEGDEVTGGS